MAPYLPLLIMAGLVIAFVLLSFIASQLLAPQRPNAAKQAPYECGIVPEQEPAERFPVKFYLVAMSFIVLDVEIVFLYPFSIVYRGLGVFGLIAMSIFILVLLVPFVYLLSVGALEWGPVKQVVERMPGPLLRTIDCECTTRTRAPRKGGKRTETRRRPQSVDGPRPNPAQLHDRPARRPRALGATELGLPATFGLACCALEMMATGAAHYDLAASAWRCSACRRAKPIS